MRYPFPTLEARSLIARNLCCPQRIEMVKTCDGPSLKDRRGGCERVTNAPILSKFNTG